MYRLLDAQSRRIAATVKLLVDSEDWITTAEIASAIGTSKRTESEDIALIRRRWGTLIGLESSIKEGFRLRKCNSATVNTVLRDLFSESIAARLLEALFAAPRMTIEFYGKATFTSASTLVRLIPKVDSFLAENEMGILNNKGCYEVVADDEQHLRDFYTSFLIELKNTTFDKEPFVGIIHSLLERTLEPEDAASIENDEMLMDYYSMFYSVSLLREDQGYGIISTRLIGDEVSKDDFSRLKEQYEELSETNLRPIHEYIVHRFHGWDSDKEYTLVQTEAAKFADSIHQVLHIQASRNSYRKLRTIVEDSYLLIKLRRHRMPRAFDRTRYFALTIEQENPAFYMLFKNNMEVFSKNTGIDISGQIGTIMLRTCLTFPSCAAFTSPKKALVVSNLGARHATFLAESINSLFNRGDFKMLDVSIDQCEPYDIVITNIPNLEAGSKKIILIEDYPRHEDFCSIMRELYK